MDWCPVCSTQHAGRRECPGELLATGPERHGVRLSVSGDGIREVYGVLVAESGDLWRARILTYPNMLWSVPGGRGTLKFAGTSAFEVQAKALDFVRRHCAARGIRILEQTADVDNGVVDPEAAPVQAPRFAQEERLPHTLPVRYGEAKTLLNGVTADLSHGGLFIVSEDLLPVGSEIKMLLQLDQYSIPLMGKVAWRRDVAKGCKAAGIGVELRNPPSMYARYVDSIKPAETDEAAAAS